MITIIRINRQFFSDFVERNQKFIKKINKYNHQLNQHQRVSHITQEQANKYVDNLSKEEIASRIVNEAKYLLTHIQGMIPSSNTSSPISIKNTRAKSICSISAITPLHSVKWKTVQSRNQTWMWFKNSKREKSTKEYTTCEWKKSNPKLHQVSIDFISGGRDEFETYPEDPFGHEDTVQFPWKKPENKEA